MVNIKVNDSLRKKRRELRDSLGDDILRYITELVTNSDDSYRRMENDNLISRDIVKKIYLETDNDIISVTDNAEGMSMKQLKNIFGTYGGDNSSGNKLHTRGIFGQGASDVLRAAASDNKLARIETIKDNKVTILDYKMDEDLNPSIDVYSKKMTPSKLKAYRKEIKISNNGTKITFGVPKRVKFTKKIRESLPTLIAKYPTFRYMLNTDNRKLIYLETFMETEITSKKYQFKEENKITEENFRFKFENEKIECALKLYKREIEDTDTNIIVRDENYNVFDNTMFAFYNSGFASIISGELIINGLYDICYEHLNRKDPDAIIRDNRTGFDTKNTFYELLSKNVNPIIEKVLNEHREDIKTTDLTNNKKFNEALKHLNKYMQSEIKNEITGGNLDGSGINNLNDLEFARKSVTLTKGKTYNIKLFINSDKVFPDDEIKITISDKNYIEVEPLSITYESNEIVNSIVAKDISITALNNTFEPISVEATVGNYKANLKVSVKDEEIYYPKDGMEFNPKNIVQSYKKEHKLKLYIDTNYIKLGEVIKITCNELDIENDKITFESKHLIDESIGVIGVHLTGGEIGKTYEVKAEVNGIVAFASITLTDIKQNEKLGGGLISRITLEASDKPYQSTFNSYNNTLTINTENPINKKIMGDMRDKDPENPTFNKEQTKYLCDIIANQAASLVVKQNNLNNFLINSLEDYEKIETLLQEHKNKIYQEMYDILLIVAE